MFLKVRLQRIRGIQLLQEITLYIQDMYEFKLVGVSKFESRCESECEWLSLCVNTVTDSGPQAAQHGKRTFLGWKSGTL